MKTTVLGIDLAWGTRSLDAITRIDFREGSVKVGSFTYSHGDKALIHYIKKVSAEPSTQVVLSIDAPLLCRNETGSRPVDKECNSLYRRFEAGCHPVNLKLCPRPIALGQTLKGLGFLVGAAVNHQRVAMEVYPHPAMIEWFDLKKTIKYKRGKVAEKKEAFAFYQRCFERWIAKNYPKIQRSPDLERLLIEEWSKKNEDGLDAYFCAFIGLWHIQHQGEASSVLGDRVDGFMVVPRLLK